MKTINLLFSIDDNYFEQLKTTLFSLRNNTPNTFFQVFVLQKKKFNWENEFKKFCSALNMCYIPLIIGVNDFKYAPVTKRYPETIYYRLLAQDYLPKDVEKILYLDADILCINDISSLYDLKLNSYLYAAASHSQLTNLTTVVNKVRLQNYDTEQYYNSGVLLINVVQARHTIKRKVIYDFIRKKRATLLLPDQDVLNSLFGDQILSLPDQVYNFDARKNLTYEMISNGTWDLDWVISNTIFLHFCGKEKPWEENGKGKFAALYKHYAHLSKLTAAKID